MLALPAACLEVLQIRTNRRQLQSLQPSITHNQTMYFSNNVFPARAAHSSAFCELDALGMGDEGKPPASLAAREAGRRRRGQLPNPPSPQLNGQQGPRPTRTCRRAGHRPYRCRRASSDATSGKHLPCTGHLAVISGFKFCHRRFLAVRPQTSSLALCT